MKGLRTDGAHVAGSLWNLSVHHQQKLLKEPSKCGQCLAHTACNKPVHKCFQLASTNQLVPISRSRAFHVEASTKGPIIELTHSVPPVLDWHLRMCPPLPAGFGMPWEYSRRKAGNANQLFGAVRTLQVRAPRLQ